MTGPGTEGSGTIEEAGTALLKLNSTRPELAESLAKLVTVIANEAARTTRFANALAAAVAPGPSDEPKPKRTGRRTPGAIDPFALYGQDGEDGLRARLGQLDLEQLRDIVAEHGMDHDRLAMKWKDPSRVIDRIIEKVSARSSKGSAFRPPPDNRRATNEVNGSADEPLSRQPEMTGGDSGDADSPRPV